MEVELSQAIEQNAALRSEVMVATELLKAQVGPDSAHRLKAEWSQHKDPKGRTLLELKISDWTGSAGYRFAPEELRNTDHMKVRLHRLWGDLLQVQSHAQIDQHWWHLAGQQEP